VALRKKVEPLFTRLIEDEGHGGVVAYFGKDVKVEFDTENFHYGPVHKRGRFLGYHTTGYGLTFCGCQGGGDWERGVRFIVYWDGKKLRAYVPTEGNPWNTDTKRAYGNDDEKDNKNIRKRWPNAPGDEECLSEWVDADDTAMLADIKRRFGGDR
jgi:hypothetical protein